MCLYASWMATTRGLNDLRPYWPRKRGLDKIQGETQQFVSKNEITLALRIGCIYIKIDRTKLES